MIDMFAEQVRAAAAGKRPLRLRGGGTKDFYGRAAQAGEVLDTRGFSGIVDYEPTELLVTARAGTPLAELEQALAEKGQMLAFEPPHFGPGATVGGCVAAGLSGPRRASVGAVRDFVLGVKIIDGRGRLLTFGGQVMKNVAGFDVSRLMAGSLGTLGLIVEVSLKVLPRPVEECSLRFEMSMDQALTAMNAWAGQPLPVSATCWHDGRLTVRLSGARAAIAAARQKLGGDLVADDGDFWTNLREQRAAFFRGEGALWRLSVPSTTGALGLPDDQLVEWGGSLRWLRGDVDTSSLRDRLRQLSGHAALFRGEAGAPGDVEVFQPLPAALLATHQRLKRAFDPEGIFNPGRLYPSL
ncbi:MAG: glycolate oxidase subunit GlcE [Rhodocyclaceae bacterium]